jgi:deoxyribodipyrimidine photolyase
MRSTSGAILWFRRDLRLSDNEALTSATENCVLAPFYCLEPQHLAAVQQPADLPFDLPVLGPYRAK